MNNVQDTANKFMEAYGDNASWVYGRIKDECLALFGDRRSFSLAALEWLELNADEMEVWIIKNVIANLESVSYPQPHSKAINDVIWNAVHKECK